MLQDPRLKNATLIVDALDECTVERENLLDFIAKSSSNKSSFAKWVVSSRNWSDIGAHLEVTGQVKLHLEDNDNQASISVTVESYINFKVYQLAQKHDPDEDMSDVDGDMWKDVLQHLTANANGTFLWVALVCHELSRVERWHILDTLKSFPPGLNPLYGRMLERISNLKDEQLCKGIIAVSLLAYRPLTPGELSVLVEGLET